MFRIRMCWPISRRSMAFCRLASLCGCRDGTTVGIFSKRFVAPKLCCESIFDEVSGRPTISDTGLSWRIAALIVKRSGYHHGKPYEKFTLACFTAVVVRKHRSFASGEPVVSDRTRTATIRCGGLAFAPHGGAIKQPSGAAMSEANGGLDSYHDSAKFPDI